MNFSGKYTQMSKSFLDKASAAYYEGNPIISDEEFDKLAERYNYNAVGSPVSSRTSHIYPLYSLKKIYDEEPRPFSGIETPKLDGSCIAIVYVNGEFSHALTRGDGREGLDISKKILAWSEVPLKIDTSEPIIQVSGEVVAPITEKNPRNYAAGALGLDKVSDFLDRNLYFFAYSAQPYTSHKSYEEELSSLSKWGFRTVLDDTSAFPKDGTVTRLANNLEFVSLGFTSHHPRGAFAHKTRKEGEITTLREVVWQLGKSGRVSPVAIFDPVDIDGAKVSRATLHNMEYINALGLDIGCKIEVIRTGEVIPRVVRVVDG